MTYQTVITGAAAKALKHLEQKDYLRIKRVLKRLSDNPRPRGCKKLTNRPGWRLRIGTYRILYDIDDQTQKIVILDIGHRRDIYL